GHRGRRARRPGSGTGSRRPPRGHVGRLSRLPRDPRRPATPAGPQPGGAHGVRQSDRTGGQHRRDRLPDTPPRPAGVVRPGTRAADLALELGREEEGREGSVRKLKNLALTISLGTGYRISPCGAAYLEAGDRLRRHERGTSE